MPSPVADALMPMQQNPAQPPRGFWGGVGNFAYDALGLGEAAKALRGQMTANEAQDFAFGAALGLLPMGRGLRVPGASAGRPLEFPVGANSNVSQADVLAMIPGPLPLQERIWGNYAKRMTPDEFLSSEPAWSGAREISETQKIPMHDAFSNLVNDMFARMGANRHMTPEMARRFMNVETAKYRGIGVVPK